MAIFLGGLAQDTKLYIIDYLADTSSSMTCARM